MSTEAELLDAVYDAAEYGTQDDWHHVCGRLRAWRSSRRGTVAEGQSVPLVDPVTRVVAGSANPILEFASPVQELDLKRHKFLACGCQEWQPIETAPRDGTWLLLWDGGCRLIGHFYPPEGRWDNADGDELKPTHWTPLPEPPVLSP